MSIPERMPFMNLKKIKFDCNNCYLIKYKMPYISINKTDITKNRML